MKLSTVCILAGLACILVLAAGCTSTPSTPVVVTPTATTAAATAVPTTAAPELSWTGTWNITWSEESQEYSAIMFLKQNATFVTGTYETGNDTLKGTITTVTGNKLVGTWEEGNSTGPFEFTMAADMKSFTGKWANTPADLANTTEFWNGVRI